MGGNGAIINSGAAQSTLFSTLHSAATQPSAALILHPPSPVDGTSAAPEQPKHQRPCIQSHQGRDSTRFHLWRPPWTRPWAILTSIKASSASRPPPTAMGDPNKTVTIASGAALEFYNTANAMNKKCVLNGGTIWGESGTGTNNTFAGPITVNSAGGIFDAGGGLTGGGRETDRGLDAFRRNHRRGRRDKERAGNRVHYRHARLQWRYDHHRRNAPDQQRLGCNHARDLRRRRTGSRK